VPADVEGLARHPAPRQPVIELVLLRLLEVGREVDGAEGIEALLQERQVGVRVDLCPAASLMQSASGVNETCAHAVTGRHWRASRHCR